MSSSFRKQLYTQASADYKDLGGFLDGMVVALRALNIYAVEDPMHDGGDTYGMIFHQGPIDPRKLWAWLRKEDPVSYEGRRFDKTVEVALTPSSLYDVGDEVVFTPFTKRHPKPWKITGKMYSTLHGWMYSGGERYDGILEERIASHSTPSTEEGEG